MVNIDVGNATGPVLGTSNGGPVSVVVDKEVGAGVGDAVGVEASTNVGNTSIAIGTVNLKTENMKEGMVLTMCDCVIIRKGCQKEYLLPSFFDILPPSTSSLPSFLGSLPSCLPWYSSLVSFLPWLPSFLGTHP